ncbi:helix-turn-helix domain-containing protein [Sunxiuqinia sp. A32]|uniref:helix-turn-helix domain-containing protein n=1 Tax=Sunxiuqinia sp. A32 TaxID=3461496 RepID=UPI004045FE7E
MPNLNPAENDFLIKITAIIEANISNEQFGVSELAQEIGMSRSNLLRKVKKLTDLSVSQFIRQVRLNKAMEILREGSMNVSEVSYQVGFSSTSYFIKCFREHYGYPPGEVGKHQVEEKIEHEPKESPKRKKNPVLIISYSVFTLIVVLVFIFKPSFSPKKELDKSIAVLPFKNDSNDSTNVYIINGLMESVLNNLQKIEDLRVISRTSVEKYRNSGKTIPEIAQELNVRYFIEGSGQKIGDQIMLNIQLIEGEDDKHLWAEQYSRDTKDIFNLQMEVAKNIAGQIEAIITPEEQKLIEEVPTDNLEAYDHFLKGQDLFFKGTAEGLLASIPWFEKAVELDPEFAQAYADLAIVYYFMDMYQAEKKYSEQINSYADKAIFYNDKLPQALLAKAFFYMNANENELAEPYLKKALEYNPNSSFVIGTLSDFYASRIPDTKKYLEYALKGISIDIASNDSASASYIYLHLSNAFIQSGFVEEAEKYINKSLEYDPANLFSAYVKPYILYAKNKELGALKEGLIQALSKDTMRFDIIQEIGKVCYYQRDFQESYKYYKRFIDITTAMHLDVYPFEKGKIGYVFDQLGKKEEAGKLFKEYFEYCQQDQSIYKHVSLAMYYSYMNNKEKAIEHLKLFAQQDNFHYWTILFLDWDPLVENIKDLPEFKKIFKQIETNFWGSHREIKKSLEQKNLI